MAAENDLVLIYLKGQPLGFARIERIAADKKPGWYQVTLLMLQVPPQRVTWILRDTYIDGAEFTMNGSEMRLERIPPFEMPTDEADAVKTGQDTAQQSASDRHAKVVSLNAYQKKS